MSRHASPHGGFLFLARLPFLELARVLARVDHGQPRLKAIYG
jgi:hypothetical protein